MFKEQNFPISKEETPKKDEEKKEEQKISLREYKENLHQHTGLMDSSLEHNKSPREIVEQREQRGASNCAKVILEAVVASNEKLGLPTFRTEHFKDGSIDYSMSPEKKQQWVTGVKKWFYSLYRKNPELLKKDFSNEKIKSVEDLGEEEQKQIGQYAENLMFYTEQRALGALENANKMKQIWTGFECNVIPQDDEFRLDAEQFIKEHRDEIKGPILASIHPNKSDLAFKKFRADQYNNPAENKPELSQEEAKRLADELTNITEKVLNIKNVNILAHIGFQIHPQIIEKLNWPAIAEKAIESKVAIEINIQDLMKKIGNTMEDLERFPFDSLNYQDYIKQQLEEKNIVNLFSSEPIMNMLKPYFNKELTIAIDTDAHKLFYEPKEGFKEHPKLKEYLPSAKINKKQKEELKKKWGNISDEELQTRISGLLNRRFWRAMKITENYFNDKFKQFDIQRKNILNLQSKEELQQFFTKK